MSGGVDRLRGRGGFVSNGAAPAARDDGAFASMLTPRDGAPAGTEAAPEAALSGVGWLQANVADVFARAAQDRQARRHGRALLQALAALQRASLRSDGTPEALASALETLAETVRDEHEADDPVLRLILREIAVRAAVELARAAPHCHAS